MSKTFSYGGQAVIEGVMMRGARRMAVAVRQPNGEIIVRTEALNPRIYNSRLNQIPFLRGITLLWDALGLGLRALTYSANIAISEQERRFEGPLLWGLMALAILLALGLFFVAPLLIIGLFEQSSGLSQFSNLLEGVLRLIILLAYIWLIGFVPKIKRVYAYHGAEHKTINAFEADAPLIPGQIARYSLIHPRCGTAFLLIVLVISVLLFALLGTPPLGWRILSRIILIPVVAGLAYEFLRFSAAHLENPFIRLLIAPGLALQRLTTRQPTEAMLKVSATALAHLLTEEGIAFNQANPALQDQSG